MKLAQHTSEGLATVEGGVRKTARTLKELMAALDAGLEQRAVAETGLNAASSRSHLLVSLVLKSSNRRSGRVVRGKLTLVDLAGSERVEKSGVAGDELKEAMSINKSLSAIGDVISALSTNQKHVPCRGPSDERRSLVLLREDARSGDASFEKDAARIVDDGRRSRAVASSGAAPPSEYPRRGRGGASPS